MNGQEQQPLTKKQRRELKRQEKLAQKKKEAKRRVVNRIIMWLIIVLLLGGTVYGLTQLNSDSNSGEVLLTDTISDRDHVKGNPEAKVILIEYSDFQCPACASYFGVVKQVMDEFSDQIYFAYRHFPLRSIHKNAQLAAQAAEAAGLQGKFWEMHDELFTNQTAWADSNDPTDIFVTYAEKIGLNVEQFRSDMTAGTVRDKVNADYRSGSAARVQGTPTFFLNGKRINNPRGLAEFKKVINDALAEAGSQTEQPLNTSVNKSEETVDTNQSIEGEE